MLYWLEQTEADVSTSDDWMSAADLARYAGLRVPKRRTEWRLGRWTAKRAAAAFLRLAVDAPTLRDIEVRPHESGAPEIYLGERLGPVSISLSHCSGVAACLVGPPDVMLGCDLEKIEPHGEDFVRDYFTAGEQELIARSAVTDHPRLTTLLWSAKESALKVLRTGLRADTRSVEVSFQPASEHGAQQAENASPLWHPLQVRCADGQLLHGWWHQTGLLLYTMAAATPAATPVMLQSM